MTTSQPPLGLTTQIAEAIEGYQRVSEENEELKESLSQVRAMMSYEDRGWQAILGQAGGDTAEGLDLDEVKLISEKARIRVAAGALEKRASDLHGGYVFGQGLEIDDTVKTLTAKGPAPAPVRFFEDPINQENLFSDGARKELQRARFTDGNVIVFCDKNTKKARRIPIYEIEGVLTSPDFPDEIWAWLRSWTHYTTAGKPETRRAWAYTNRFTGNAQKTISYGGKPVPVLPDTVAVDLRANRQVGWVYGIPDATTGMLWTEAYGQVLRYGQIVNEQLASVVYKVVQKTVKGAQSAGLKMKTASGPGGTAVVGEGQDISLVNSAQRSFDFTAARPLAAMAASAWNVSNIDLLSDSSAAGSSYGAASALTSGIQNAMRGMQLDWTQFFQDIFQVMGLGRPGIHWAPMEAPDPYREAQELTLYAPALLDSEYRGLVLDRLNIAGDPNNIPPSLKQRVVDTSKTGAQAASPDQGQNSDAGATDSGAKNDQRTDTIEALRQEVANENFLARFEALVSRAENTRLDG